MRYVSIEGNSKKFSTIALGSTYFGTHINEKTSYALLDEFANQGGTTIDTALVYGQENSNSIGMSEKIIGKWLKSNNMYKEMAIITKGCHPDLKSNKSRISYENMEKDLNFSFDSLQTSSIDLWFFHRDDPEKSIHSIIDILPRIESKFPITTFGASNWSTQRIEESRLYSYQNQLPIVRASEIHYSLATTDIVKMGDESLVIMDDKAHLWYEKHQFPLFAFSSQAKGFFSKAAQMGGIDSLNEKITSRYVSKENLSTLKRLKEMSKKLGISVTSLVIAYITSSPFPSVAIIGPSHIEQLKDSLSGKDVSLSPVFRDYIKGIDKGGKV